MTTTITCFQCGGPLGPGDQFCAQCGAELLWCASCGEFLSEQSCPKCGTPGIPRPASHSIPYELSVDDSPWIEVVARLRRATLGEFEIGHELGRGGMAAVFLAHELSLHRDVAIKVMSPGLLMGDGMIERFRREAITIAHLNHPNIVSVYSVRAVEGLHFFVMRCIQGRSLEHVIRDAGRLPLPIVRSVLYQVGSALAYAHRFKVIHRDIKPANILIDEDGNAVVTDFGIAKAAEGPSHTHSGFMVGTPAYMSPEQCSGGEVSGASDQYSLGAVAYEMITGVPPFTGSTYSVIQAHVERQPQPLTEHCEDCPPELEAAILRMLAKNPEERWPGMPQALAALGAVALPDDDPSRALLSRLSTAERRGMNGDSHSNGQQNSAVLQVTPPGMMRAITILPPPPGLEVGDSFLLVARVHDGKVARLPGEPVEWSSDTPGVLRVNATKAVATAVSPGTALIKAICDGNEGRLRVTVASPRADAIDVKPIERAINVGDEIRLEATPRDKRGRMVSRPIIWHSDDDAVATVSLDGLLVARSGGSTRITAELDEARSTLAITVAPSPVAALHISPPPDTVVSGESFALTATPLDRWAGPLTGRTISWTVSDVGVAVVTAGGWVITRNPGLVVLTATCENATASVSVNVVAKKAEPIPAEGHDRPVRPAARPQSEPWETVPDSRPSSEPQRRRSRPTWVIGAGGAAMIAAGLWLVGGRRPQSDPAPLTETAVAPRESAAGESVSSNDSGIKSGALSPTAAADSSSPASITIVQRPSAPLQLGTTAELVAEVRDVHGDILGRHPISWSTTDSAVASVDSATGSVRAMGPGRAQIVAAAGTRRDTARIVVHAGGKQPVRAPAPTVEPVSLSMAPHDPIRVGDTTTLVVAAVDGAGKPLRRVRVTWSSSEPRVADVDAAGRVRAYSPGSTLIIARSGSESAMGPLTVLPASVASVNITGAQPLKVGDTLTLQAEARDQQGISLSGRSVAWASSNPDVAPVDSASGVVIAQQAGSAQITATVEGKSGAAKITILPQPRTGRSEPPPVATQASPRVVASANDAAREHQQVVEQMVAGVEQCYQALHDKDVVRVHALYNPADKVDEDRLKKLSRILSTHEWDAQVGERQDGAQRVGDNTARMDFSFRLTWKDAFGGRLSSDPAFRAEFSMLGDQLTLSSCRIINSPKL